MTGRIRVSASIKSPRIRGEALGFVVALEQKFIQFPLTDKTRTTLNHSTSSLSPTLLCGSHDSCPHTSCVWEWAYGVAEEDEKEAYQGLAMGAKLEGIMESLTQQAQSSLQGKICAKKNQRESFLLCKLWSQNCCRGFFSAATLLYIRLTPLTTVKGTCSQQNKTKSSKKHSFYSNYATSSIFW